MFLLFANFSHNKDEIIYAAVVTSQKIVDLMGRDLLSHFIKHNVHVLNISHSDPYSSDAVTLVLSGKENNIKKSLNQLKKVCLQKEIGLEKVPIHSLPPVLKGYLSDMEDKERFEKIFSYCSKEYLDFCKSHGVKPHPEVVESGLV